VIQLRILSGRKAGTASVARRFPVRIGRSANADLRLEEDGVWEQHVVVEFKRGEGYLLAAQGDALISVNGEPSHKSLLHNGDCITIGSVELRFWLAEVRQSGLAFRETVAWLAIGAVCLAQFALLYWLVR
jgi:pSer/pThr/pTyr-binding forkhead associated (FHA) protein